MSTDFFDGYVQGKQLSAARDIAQIRDQLIERNNSLEQKFWKAIEQRDEALEYNKSINEKYRNLVDKYNQMEVDLDMSLATKDAACERIRQLGDQFGLSEDEVFGPAEARRDVLFAERRQARETESQ